MKKTFSERFDKNCTQIPFKTNFRDNKKSDTILISRKIMKCFKILDGPINVSKIYLSVTPKSVLEFKTQISGTKI